MKTPPLKRRCTKCKKKKDPSEFYNRPDGLGGGLTSHCKRCRLDYCKSPHARALDNKRPRKKIYLKEWRTANGEWRKEYQKAWREQNKERLKKWGRQYYLKHKEKIDAAKKEWFRKNKKRTNASQRLGYMRRTYGLSPAEFDQKLASQNGRCAICGELPQGGRRLSVDHDHQTGKNRGLLCNPCNSAIGFLKEDPTLFAKALAYLRHYARKVVMKPRGKISLQAVENGGTRA